jgi:hypothetical protein
MDGPAYASSMDKADEEYRAGLHIVVGRVHLEPPEFHCEVTVDGARFPVADLGAIIAGYQRRREREVPQAWLDRLTVKSWSSSAVTFVYQPARRSGPEIQDAVSVDKAERATANGVKSSHEITTMTVPLTVPQRPDSSTQNQP